jgi:AraC-like DNA-binding protein
MVEEGLVAPGDKPRGILDFGKALSRFELRRFPPQGRLAAWLEGYWQVSWDLGEGEEHLQSNISHASYNIVFEEDGIWLYGVPDRVFSKRLAGRGAAFGAKFLPGGFHPFARFDLSRYRGKRIRLHELWPEADDSKARRALESGSARNRVAAMASILEPRMPERPARSTALATRMEAEPSAYTVARAAAELGLGERALEKLFRNEVGVGPKEVLRRYRLQSAAERLARPDAPACGDLALELGYADQAHFIKDFKAVVGRPPMAYRADQAESPRG